VASVDAPDEDFELATHGDILSNVHGLATRAAPKPAKMKARKPKEDKPDAPANPRRRKVAAKDDKSIERAVKKRKEAGPKAKESEDSLMEEATRTLKAKASTLSAEYVVDISDLENSSTTTPDKRPTQSAVITTTEGSGHAVQSATHLATSPQLKPLELEPVTPRPPDRLNLDLPDIHSQITKAITNYVPLPSRDHQRDPTWHEKILMYEPIVLEDLATWLNTEGLRLVGEDREVSALEVRAWCEMKGVCCYGVGGGWRGSAKGKTGANIG
jgi:Slx4 endonuclease